MSFDFVKGTLEQNQKRHDYRGEMTFSVRMTEQTILSRKPFKRLMNQARGFYFL